MDRKRKLAIVFATVAVAAGSGHLMQSGRGAEAAVAALAVVPDRPAPAPAPAPPAALAEVAVPATVPALAATVAAIADPGRAAGPAAAPLPSLAALSAPAADAPAMADVLSAPPAAAAAPPRDCTPRLTLLPAPEAMVDLILAAPCDSLARVVIRHEGLALTARTGPDGGLVLTLPAMAEEARVAVALPGGATAEAAVAVPALAAWDRLGVQWQAPDRFELHAFEGSATYGAPGHLYAGAPQGATGFLTLLGDDTVERAMLAEILSLPRGALAEGALRVTVEAPVTAATCGRDLLAEVVAMRDGAAATATELILAAPDCRAAGDWLVMPWDTGAARLAGN